MKKNIGAYFEIPVLDLDRAVAFYSELLGCEFSKGEIHGHEMAFFSYNSAKLGIAGALCKGEIYKPSVEGTLVYLNTEDISKTIERAIALGSKVLFEPTQAGDWGLVAEIKDCEGNRIALFEATNSQ